MPFYTIDEFESQILNIDVELNLLNNSEDTQIDLYDDEAREDGREYGVFVFYQNDIDGICSMFILEHHKKFRSGLKLRSYPVNSESDIYTYIKKELSMKSAIPTLNADVLTARLQGDKYLRVVLLGINGWSDQILYAIKLYFLNLLPEEYKRLFKMAVLTTTRPLSFFNTTHNDEWYFFLQDESDIIREIQQEELQSNENVVISGIYKMNATSSLVESVVDCVNECDKAIVIFANCIGILSNHEFNNNYNINLTTQIINNRDKINSLQGGPYVKYDTDKLLTPLITLSSFEESLKISPYILIYDPNIRDETLSEIRIHCNLKLDEYTSQFTNLPPSKQAEVLQSLKKKLDVTKNKNQLLWIRRTITISSLDVMYIILSVQMRSFYSTNVKNDNNDLIVTDFLYKILIERVYEESGYDKGILIKLKNYTMDFIQYIYKLAIDVGYSELLVTTIYPTYSVTLSCHLSFISYLILSIYTKRKSEDKTDNKTLLLFIKNPAGTGGDAEKTNGTGRTNGAGSAKDNAAKNSSVENNNAYVIFGYNSETSRNNGDVWPLVFKSVAHENRNFLLDCLNPNIVYTNLNDVTFIRNQIVNNLKIVLKIQYQTHEESNTIDPSELL
ncbi:conserved hypothetical protein [Theileria orientalis strain Shintoku]|uniref:Uncharacterized protein n=1 Tax=Theileria orientalis strain Shintoku TaxID=869250 RepID=J4D5R3_THEOR|nr:conserved hypothetical protein [Theileria orientalis strain Shintoku]PVC52851.1 hypothetical protein MACL_00000487 [Theileria orientalis]BAM39130.1 conserved hypothetical protein [Theileria orientalis strain Shintoku]|eukprot:XP_009689431.1 conserved hypothetical protein [Theileria orientalis strain Shintoku]